MKRLEFVYFEAGGGHRSAATALQAVARQQGRDWDVQLFQLQEKLDELDLFRKVTRVRFQDLYNLMLAKGWTLGAEYLLPPIHALIRLFHSAQVRMLTGYWLRSKPDMVVSVIPNFNRALFQASQTANPGTPFVTILTDFADYPPHFWLEEGQDQYVICGTEKAYEQAMAAGMSREKTFLVSGMILRPDFYTKLAHDRAEERRKLGLDPARPTGLLLFGGQGSSAMRKIVRDVQNVGTDVQLIAICGRNASLAEQIRSIPSRIPVHVLEFTTNVPYYMSLCDFLIGKPGPGSLSEAFAMGLPVIVERNAWTLPQERYNADWVRENEVGLVLDSFRDICKSVQYMTQPDRLADFRSNVAKIQNRAVFEILDILDEILSGRR